MRQCGEIEIDIFIMIKRNSEFDYNFIDVIIFGRQTETVQTTYPVRTQTCIDAVL